MKLILCVLEALAHAAYRLGDRLTAWALFLRSL